MGVNRMECRSCPYEWPLEQKWFDKTDMKEKEVEQALGGKDEWKNADSMASELSWGGISRIFEFCSSQLTNIVQHNALRRDAMVNVHTFTSCRSAVQTSR